MLSADPAVAALAMILPVLAAAAVLVLWGGRADEPEAEPDDAATAEPVDPDDASATSWRRWAEVVRRRFRRPSAGAAELPVLDDLSAALDAGLPVGRALGLALEHRATGPARHEPAWAGLSRAAAEGQGLAPAWARLARVTRSPTVAAVSRAWRVASLCGAPLADALRVSAHTSRERQRLERAVEAATAGARATATVLTLLPVAGVGLAAVLGVSPARLYGTPAAWASVGLGALLLLGGQVMVRKLIARVVRDLA